MGRPQTAQEEEEEGKDERETGREERRDRNKRKRTKIEPLEKHNRDSGKSGPRVGKVWTLVAGGLEQPYG